ncbi:hypothetical protein BGW38_002354 [Lunasporangiospora selenospora]|uniref:Transmembrane protein n=1 Tax=Lunasporangiospora selenospora TaxID=979761 RepID=A0A9P6KCY9_9FUNG|nr:hypothetical protein BGW38_002354 [Lunasporangiospora selenospora]
MSLLPAPKARNYRAVGAVCILASGLTLCSNILYMLRGWKEPTHLFDLATTIIRWMTTQLWYVLGMTLLFHVVTRPAQSGVVLFGKFPRDLWTNKWYLCILYIPVHYMLLELCDIHRDTIQILIPLEIIVDVLLYNGPFLIVLLRLIYLSWKVAYDEAVLTGAVFEEDEDGHGPMDGGSSNVRRGQTAVRPGSSGYVGLAMVDLDEAERGERHSGSDHDDGHLDSPSTKSGAPIGRNAGMSPEAAPTNAFVLEEEDDIGAISSLKPSPAVSPKPPPPPKSKKTVMFDVDSPKVATIELEDEDHHLLDRGVDQHDQPLLQSSGDDRHEEEGPRV